MKTRHRDRLQAELDQVNARIDADQLSEADEIRYCELVGQLATIEALEEMAEKARPETDDDWGTGRQIAAENAFFEAVAQFIHYPALQDDLDEYCHKATTNEMIDYALTIVDMQGEIDTMKITRVHVVPEPEDPKVVWYLCDLAAWGSHPAEKVTEQEALQQVLNGEVLQPHYYSVERDDGLYFYVPDGSCERSFRIQPAAQTHLKIAISQLWG